MHSLEITRLFIYLFFSFFVAYEDIFWEKINQNCPFVSTSQTVWIKKIYIYIVPSYAFVGKFFHGANYKKKLKRKDILHMAFFLQKIHRPSIQYVCCHLMHICKHGSKFETATMATKMTTIRGHRKQHIASEFQQNWSSSFLWNLFTSLKIKPIISKLPPRQQKWQYSDQNLITLLPFQTPCLWISVKLVQ